MADGFAGGFDPIDLCRWVGQTVTIYTTSGGPSGVGFTGVLIAANDCFVKLIVRIGAAPECALGSNCGPYGRGGYGFGGFGCSDSCGYGGFGGFGGGLGSVVIIPTDRIVSFVHNAI